jgi:hypothetical protein
VFYSIKPTSRKQEIRGIMAGKQMQELTGILRETEKFAY